MLRVLKSQPRTSVAHETAAYDQRGTPARTCILQHKSGQIKFHMHELFRYSNFLCNGGGLQ